MFETSFGGSYKEEIFKFINARDVLIILEMIRKSVNRLMLSKQEHFPLPVHHQEVILVKSPEDDRVVLLLLLLHFFHNIIAFQISTLLFLPLLPLVLGDLPQLKFIVAPCREHRRAQGLNKSDGSCMSELLLDDLLFLPVPKNKIAVVTSEH